MRRHFSFVCSTVLVFTAIARAEVTDVQAKVETTVKEIAGGSVVQSDSALLEMPGSAAKPPLVVRGSLSRTDAAGSFLSGARGMVVFSDLSAPLSGSPSNIGFDIAAFSTTTQSGWEVEALASERRSIVIRSAEAGQGDGSSITASSALVLSGVLFIASQDPAQDLTGAEAHIEFIIDQILPTETKQVLEGKAVLSGVGVAGVNAQTAGAVNSFFHNVVSLDGVVPEFPVLRAVIFVGVLPTDQYSYNYDAVVGDAFDLMLTVKSSIKAPPGKIGCAAVFGVPQEGFADLFQKAKQSDAGLRLQNEISSLVDTTGSDHPAVDTLIYPKGLFGLSGLTCGALGLETMGLAAVGLFAGLLGRTRRRGPRRGC